MKIIDNFLSDDKYQDLFSFIADDKFPWFFGNVIEDSKLTQFTHCFYTNDEPTPLYKVVSFFKEKLQMSSLVRIKANLNPRTEKLQIHDDAWHSDFPNMTTAIYYLNTCDGYTKFENGKISNSVANRIVIFDSNLKHTGTSCTDSPGRLLINFNDPRSIFIVFYYLYCNLF